MTRLRFTAARILWALLSIPARFADATVCGWANVTDGEES